MKLRNNSWLAKCLRIFGSISLVLALTVISAILYFVTLRGVKGNVDETRGRELETIGQPFESSHERSPYALILSLDKSKKTDLSQSLADFGSPDVGYYNGKYFILFPPGISLLGYPFYELGKQFNFSQIVTYSSIAIYGILSVLMLYFIARHVFSFPRWAAVLVGLLFAFGTTSWSYAITIYQHLPTTFFLLLGFYAAWAYKQKSKYSFLWASIVWLSYGVGFLIDFPSVFLALPNIIYMCLSSISISHQKEKTFFTLKPLFIVASVFFIVLALIHGYYNYKSFGDWKKFGQSISRYEGKEKFELKLQQRALEATLSAQLQPHVGSGNPLAIFKEQKIISGLYTLTFANDKGIFFYSPVLILAIIGIWLNRKKMTLEYSVFLSIVLINFFLYASFDDPWGGWAYGPRYVIPSMSVLSLFTVLFMLRFRFAWIGRLIFFILFLISSAIALLGVITTNIVPPSVEGIPLGLPYNYVGNIIYLFNGITGNFLLNEYLRTQVTPMEYFSIIYTFLIFVISIVLFIGPLFNRKKYEY
jgi:hypothetical protein